MGLQLCPIVFYKMIYKIFNIVPPRIVYSKSMTHKVIWPEDVDTLVKQYGPLRPTPHSWTKEALETYDVIMQYPLPVEKPERKEESMACGNKKGGKPPKGGKK